MTSFNTIHIISLQVPYPADYGGVIDIFHKIRLLHESGWKIHLHNFIYGREEAPLLESYCERVYYYPRKTGLGSQFSVLPYIVKSRRAAALLKNLSMDHYPVLFEGVHCTYLLGHPALRNRMKILRAHNIEHHYYLELARAEKSLWKKLFFLSESLKLRIYQSRLKQVQLIAAISEADFNYFDQRFGNAIYLPPFHSGDKISLSTGRGEYMLFHGNMGVSENRRALDFIVREILPSSPFSLLVAGRDIPEELMRKWANRKSDIQFVSSPSAPEMEKIIRNAHVILLYSFQSTGIKLKLIDSLYKGRFCIANDHVLPDQEAGGGIYRANSPEEILTKLREVKNKSFSNEDLQKRRAYLQKFDNRKNTALLSSAIGRGNTEEGN